MIKKIIVLLAFAALGVFLTTVAQAETVRGEGRYISNKLTHLMPFTSVDVRGDVQVELWQRDTQSVSVSGKSNLVELADIRVEDGTLVIDFKRPIHIKGSHSLHVTIGIPHVQSITVRGKGRVRVRSAFETSQVNISAGDEAYVTGDWFKADLMRAQATNKAEIDLEHLQVKKLEAAQFDKAKMEFSGFAQDAQLVNNGSKEIDAADLRANQAHVQVNGSGEVEVFAAQTLKAEALGKGDIVYHGRPVLTRSGNVKNIQPAFEN